MPSEPGPVRRAGRNQFAPLSATGDAISGEAAIEYSPGLNPPWTASLGSEFDFKLDQLPSYVRLDMEFESAQQLALGPAGPAHLAVQPVRRFDYRIEHLHVALDVLRDAALRG